MGHPPKQLVIGIPNASFDGKYWGRWPLGNKPVGAALSGSGAAAASSSGALATVIKLAGAAIAAAAAPADMFAWYPLPAPGACDTNSFLANQTYPAGSYIRFVTLPVHVTVDLMNLLWANDINDFCTAASGYTGADSAVLEIRAPNGSKSQFTANVTVS